LGFGVGIAQGHATLGQIGFSERFGYTSIGTVCNVAARLCGEAKDGQILLSQRVHVALKGSVATEQVGALALKGLTQPIVAYNVPSRTAVDIDPETVRRLFTDFDNFVGVKETTKDFEHFSRVLHACGRSLLVWSGIELLCLPLLALGGAGFVSAVANLAPTAVARMYELWEAGDFDGARDLHYRLHPLVDLLFVETNPAPAKWVLAQQGRIASPHVRPPLITPTAPGLARIRTLLTEGGDLTQQLATQANGADK